MNNTLKAQYNKVDELRTQKAKIEGDDPHREMTGEELRQLFVVSDKLTEAVVEMKRLEAEDSANQTHPSEQADF